MSDLDHDRLTALQRSLLSRRSLLRGALGMSMAGLLVACGGDDDEDTENGDTASDSPTATPEPEATGGTTPTEEADGSGDGETRSFEHALGVAEIPADPQRVAILNIIALDAALLTGLTPVAAVIGREMPWRDDVGAIETQLGFEVDAEQLLNVSPDIMLDGAYDGGLFSGLEPDILERIAPVVAYDFENDLQWPEYFLFFADALNRLDEAEHVLEHYQERIDALREQLGDNPPSVALLRVRPDEVRNYTEIGFVARIFDDLGIPTWGPEDWEFSLERVGEIDTDVIYLFGSENDPEALQAEVDEITSSPVWQSLPAVESDSTHAMEAYWFGFGPTEAMLVLDDIERTLLDASVASKEPDFFPVAIEHKFGETTIESLSERVVAVGLVEQDALLALGAVPVATREWYGEKPGAIFPWAEDELGDADLPVRLDFELDFERVAALEPDLIVGLYSGLTQEEYDILSEIAPTVAQPEEYVDWGIPWQELTVKVGQILGKQGEAEDLVAGVEQAFADARAEYPQFDGATGVVASPFGLPENYWVYSSQDVRGRIMSLLAFDVPEVFDEMAGEGFGATVSIEQLDLIGDLDVLVWVSSEEPLADVTLYQSLPVVQEGRALYYGEDNPVYDAMNFGTVLSLPFAIERLAPDLAAAIDGDPATQPAD
ncbi:hypothetical protein BH23CHL2_BH23CHL2_27330 [soil metagenome]